MVFAKGQSGNPSGQTGITSETRALARLSRTEFQACIQKFLDMDRATVQAIAEDPGAPMLDVMLASVLHKAVKFGDIARLEWLVSRVIGKVPDVVETTNYTTVRNDPQAVMLAVRARIEKAKLLEDVIFE